MRKKLIPILNKSFFLPLADRLMSTNIIRYYCEIQQMTSWKKEEIESACYSHYANIFARTVANLLPEYEDQLTSYALINARSAEVHAKAIAENRTEFYPELGATLGYSPLKCAEVAGEMYSELGPLLDQYDVFICPANNLPAVAADVDLLKDPVVINGKEVTGRDMCWTMAYPFNMLGRLPVISVPSGFASNPVLFTA